MAFAAFANSNCLPEKATPGDVRVVLECELSETAGELATKKTDQMIFWQSQAATYEELAGSYESSGQDSLLRLSNNLQARAKLAAADI